MQVVFLYAVESAEIFDIYSVAYVDVVFRSVEGTSAEAGGAEKHFVILECGRLENDFGAVGKRPFGNSGFLVFLFRYHFSGFWRAFHELCSGHFVFVGGYGIVFFHFVETGYELFHARIFLAFGAEDYYHAVVVGHEIGRKSVYIVNRYRRQGRFYKCVFHFYARHRLLYEEIPLEFAHEGVRGAFVLVGIRFFIRAYHGSFGTFQFGCREAESLYAFGFRQQCFERFIRTSGRAYGDGCESIQRTYAGVPVLG